MIEQMDVDNIEALESKETGRRMPLGWQLLFWGLILFGIYYVVAYTPAISGWSQERAYTESVKP
ncbi:MAG TPA: cbb3-type cytochrome c oxidase N-terminal domain-containing protein [Nitrospirota bacterium]|nr:cbb3-type cytochrome c oxidase N-terminal domain-containing protein [Nitrospirota bacterium]